MVPSRRKKASALLAALMLVSFLASACSGGNDPAETAPGAGAPASETAAVTETSYYDTITVPDFKGASFTILCRTKNLDEVYAEMETGEVVNDAVFARNRNVEERLGIELKITDTPGDWANKDLFIQTVTSSVMANDDSFQLVAGYMNYMPALILQDLFTDIRALPFVDMDDPWWVRGFNDNVTINGRTYAAIGDLCSTVLRYAFCISVNVGLLQDQKVEVATLYDEVRAGKWTFDRMTSLAAQAASDLNGDGVMDKNDRFGLGMHYMPVRALTNAFAIDYTTRDANGYPVVALYGERFQSAYDKIAAEVKKPYWLQENDWGVFHADHMLFYADVLGTLNVFRDMESPFGVLPMPKYDEAQDSYRTEAGDTTSILMVPVSIDNSELAGLALESLNYESMNLVTPAYFTTAMQNKYARDKDSQEMMQLIRDTLYFDFGYVFAGTIGGIQGYMQFAMTDDSAASKWEAEKGTYKANMDKILKYFTAGK